MPPIQFKSTRLTGYDEDGGAEVRLRTNRKDYGLGLRAFTQTDANYVFGSSPLPDVPTDVTTYVSYLEQERLQRIRDSPSWYAGRVDDDLFNRVESLNPGALRILAGETPSDQGWDSASDVAWVHAGVGSKADVIALPARADETPRALFQRLSDSRELMDQLPENEQKEVVPTVRLDSNRFVSTVERLVDAGARLFLVEFHGWSRATGNLAELHDILLDADEPPYVVGTNVPPYASDHNGSGTLLASKFGIQASAPRVFRGVPQYGDTPEQEIINDLQWFSRSHGGYIRARNLPSGWHDGCECPDADTDLASVGLDHIFAVRRRHSTWAHLQEVESVTSAIDRGEYEDAYLDRRPLLRNTVQALS